MTVRKAGATFHLLFHFPTFPKKCFADNAWIVIVSLMHYSLMVRVGVVIDLTDG